MKGSSRARVLVAAIAILISTAACLEPLRARASAVQSDDELSSQAEETTSPWRTVELMGDAKYRWGFLLRTYWAVAGESSAKNVGIINFQPNCTLQIGNGRTLSLGQTQLVYDMAASRWKPTAKVDCDFQEQRGNPARTFRAGITMLMPRR